MARRSFYVAQEDWSVHPVPLSYPLHVQVTVSVSIGCGWG
jgi:hypothetical protein